MQIYRPIKSDRVTQGFGENKACLDRMMKIATVNSAGFCPAGYQSLYRMLGMLGHNGIDIASYDGEPCYFSTLDDTEWFAKNETDGRGGVGVEIISTTPIDGEYVKFIFWHLKKSLVADGQKVIFGQKIGLCDNTGYSTGPHLHWGMKYCKADGIGKNKDNGYLGAVPFKYANTFVLQMIKKLKLLIVANNCDWPTLEEKIERLKNWFLPKINFEISVEKTKYQDVPFTCNAENFCGVDSKWYDDYITPEAKGYDIVLLVLPVAQWKGQKARGWRTDRDSGPVELQIGADEKENNYYPDGTIISTFEDFGRHEICHAVYMIMGTQDNTHKYWDEKNLRKCLTDFIFPENKEVEVVSIVQKMINLFKKAIELFKSGNVGPEN